MIAYGHAHARSNILNRNAGGGGSITPHYKDLYDLEVLKGERELNNWEGLSKGMILRPQQIQKFGYQYCLFVTILRQELGNKYKYNHNL